MPGMPVVIRMARENELPLISALEKSGEGLFRAAGMDRIADAPAPDPGAYRPALHGGRLLVAVGEQDAVTGFIRLEILDGDPTSSRSAFTPTTRGAASERPSFPPLRTWPAPAGTSG